MSAMDARAMPSSHSSSEPASPNGVIGPPAEVGEKVAAAVTLAGGFWINTMLLGADGTMVNAAAGVAVKPVPAAVAVRV